ncbi:hypothetical protein FNH08_03480 [Streptomyces spongiae]|uniref:DUF6777 domain-containing protein n=2 Tax=Streptomyces spongiae TaxID=565072 RepID=A0A5N8X9V4_9ACTN|nr:hypothetical protein [Streptomyces spongiae]
MAVVFSRSGGGSDSDGGTAADGEVFLQPAAETGPDPFTPSSATDSSVPPETSSATPTQDTNVVRSARGDAPGLYGGTRDKASCDTEKQIGFLGSAPDKNRAFASAEDVQPSGVADYLRSLTPLQLRYDTRVTNHGFRGGEAAPYQAVLQTGTAVLVDDRGVPRVRCACGNPLTPPVAQKSTLKVTGDPWPGYQPQKVVVVQEAATIMNMFVVINLDSDEWFERLRGDTGGKDKKTNPPKNTASPSASTGSPTSKSPSPSSSPPSPSSSSPKPSSSSPKPSPSSPSASKSSPSTPTTQSPPTADSPGTTSASGDLDTPDTVTAPSPGL